MTDDFFACMGLPRRFDLDRAAIEGRYLELSRELHPDRFIGGSSAERRAALERSSALNEAYRGLRDPIRRAEHLCKLGGIDLDSDARSCGAPTPSQAFLVEMIEARELLAEATTPGEREALREKIEAAAEERLAAAAAALEGGMIRDAAEALVIHRYLRRFLDEIDGAQH